MKLPNVNLTAVCNYGYCNQKPKYWDTKRMMYVCPDHIKILKMKQLSLFVPASQVSDRRHTAIY